MLYELIGTVQKNTTNYKNFDVDVEGAYATHIESILPKW